MSAMENRAGPASVAEPIAAATVPGAVHLTVADLGRVREFYERVIGLTTSPSAADGELVLAAPGGPPLIVLRGDAQAPPRDPRAPGLYHLALLFPTRVDLAHALARVAGSRWPLSGASDHVVSEALYLNDPEGNGIELYRDRPRTTWPRDAAGALRMAALALDLHDLLGEVGDPAEIGSHVPPGTRMGHVHLQVADLRRAREFYVDLLGFEVMVSDFPGALFVAAGGYHHHLGLNIWNSRGARPAPLHAAGMAYHEIVVPDAAELARARERLSAGGVMSEAAGGEQPGILVKDPSGTGVLLRCA